MNSRYSSARGFIPVATLILGSVAFLLAPTIAQAQCLGNCPADSKFSLGLQGGIDRDTDATVLGLSFGANAVIPNILLAVILECGAGNQHFGYTNGDAAFAKTNGGFEISDDYRVLVVGAQARYPFTINESNGIQAGPLVGPRIYNWNLKDCDFCESETSVMLDVGASVLWRFLGVDAFTSLDGPNFSVRVRVMTGFGAI